MTKPIHTQISRDERWAICKECEHLRKNATCKKCNCFMIVKVAIPMLHCPIDKWQIYPPQ